MPYTILLEHGCDICINMEIPKIIHQIWSDFFHPLPDCFKELSQTWKHDYPEWKYEFWDDNRMNQFVINNYPQYWEFYNRFPYDIQRWDAIRYLILDKMGGMYVDFDYESIKPLDQLLEDKRCCFAAEPEHTYSFFDKNVMFNNALMLSVPEHPFIQNIIHSVFCERTLNYPVLPKDRCVLNTTGPFLLIDLYNNLPVSEKSDVYLVPAKFVTPFDGNQAKLARAGVENSELETCLEDAYAVHYFIGNWKNEV